MWKIILLLFCWASFVISLHRTGKWNMNESVHIISRFGIQQLNPLNAENTKGFIYGNVTYVGENISVNENSKKIA